MEYIFVAPYRKRNGDMMTTEELNEIQAFLEEPLSEDSNMIEARGAQLNIYLARSGKMYADAKAEYNKALQAEIMGIIREVAQQAGASHTAINQLVKAAAYKEQQLVDYSERIHKTCVRQLDWCRSVMSKHKEEMRMNQYGGGGL